MLLPPPPEDPKKKRIKIKYGSLENKDKEGKEGENKGEKKDQRKKKRKREDPKEPKEPTTQNPLINLEADPESEKKLASEGAELVPGWDTPFHELENPVLVERLKKASKAMISEKDGSIFKQASQKDRMTKLQDDFSKLFIDIQLVVSAMEGKSDYDEVVRIANIRLERLKKLKEELQTEVQAKKKAIADVEALEQKVTNLTKELQEKNDLLADGKKLALDWLDTQKGQDRDLAVNKASYSQGVRITELSYELAWDEIDPKRASFQDFKDRARSKLSDAFALFESEEAEAEKTAQAAEAKKAEEAAKKVKEAAPKEVAADNKGLDGNRDDADDEDDDDEDDDLEESVNKT